MLEAVPQMVGVIPERRSHRYYYQVPLRPEDASKVESFITKLDHLPFSHDIRFGLFQAIAEQNLVYFKGPKHFVSFLSDKSRVSQSKLGFIGELIVLYAESQAIKTCWVGHYKKDVVRDIVMSGAALPSDSQIFCIVTLGYVPDKTGLIDRVSQRRLSKKDKPLEYFLHESSIREIPEIVNQALRLASMAPSAMNSQKWYYLVTEHDGSFRVELSKIRGYRHFKWPYYDIDVGTSAAHLWLGLVNGGVTPQVEVVEEGDRAVWRFSFSL
jgi:nitroreductase